MTLNEAKKLKSGHWVVYRRTRLPVLVMASYYHPKAEDRRRNPYVIVDGVELISGRHIKMHHERCG